MSAEGIYEMQSQLCKALGHPARLKMVHILRGGPLPVNKLAEGVGLSQATLSRHLSALRQAGLVNARQQGTEHIYQLSAPIIGLICDLMRQMLAEQLAHQAEIAEELLKRT
jgi:ArsR family transcriptional regulator